MYGGIHPGYSSFYLGNCNGFVLIPPPPPIVVARFVQLAAVLFTFIDLRF
jgi:hypothetical protein